MNGHIFVDRTNIVALEADRYTSPQPYLHQHLPPRFSLGWKSTECLFVGEVGPEGGLEVGLRLSHLGGIFVDRPKGAIGRPKARYGWKNFEGKR